jgi:glycosyltransferase involved in cell wall biosynthesis
MQGISGVVITFNEEDRIRDCLKSLDFVNEIIVVDSNSSDQTGEIAGEYTDKIFKVDWKGYAAAKNFGIDNARNDWILSLDADERISCELKQSIIKQNLDLFAGYWISRKTYYLDRWIRGGGWYPDRQLRLFNRLNGRFQVTPVHERVLIEGKTGTLNGDILHYSYRNISDHIRRIDTYSSLISEKWFRENRHATPFMMMLRPSWEFFRCYFIQRGFRDGRAGLVQAGMHAFYTFLKFAKTLERQISHSSKKKN